jgi:hypothetical protein
VLQKVGKGFAITNTQAATLQVENQRLKYQLEAARPQRKRKRIAIDHNQRFAEVEDIRRAIDQAAASEAKSSQPAAKKVTKTVDSGATTTTFDSMCINWRLE